MRGRSVERPEASVRVQEMNTIWRLPVIRQCTEWFASVWLTWTQVVDRS